MYYNNPSGWSLGFAGSSEKTDHTDSDTSQSHDDKNITDSLKVPSGLHCGPAGRRTLIKWLEDNYKLRRGMHNANPGVMACRLWQQSQGFTDPVAKAIVELLKLQGVPCNVTYKLLFENYLCKQLSTLIKRSSKSQQKLASLAEKMMAMFQVTQIQPLISDVLDVLIEIPQISMTKLLEDTTSAHQFYRITTLNVKRKIWAASAAKMYYAFEPLISRAFFLLQLGIMDIEMSSNSIDNLKEYNVVTSQIVELIGDFQMESSKIIYHFLIHLLKLLFIKSVLDIKSDSNVNELAQLSFNVISLSSMREKWLNEKLPIEDLYFNYTIKSIGLECFTILDLNDDFIYTGKGEFLLSTLRYSIAMKYQEMYRISNTEMLLLEPKFNLLHLIHLIYTNNYKLPNDEIKLLLMKKDTKNFKNIKVKDDMDLFDVSFILCNPILSNAVMNELIHSLFDTNMMFLSIQRDVNDWLSLLSLGLSASYIGLVMFIIDLESHNRDNKNIYVSYLKPYTSVTRPISLKKLLSYVYPIDKPSDLDLSLPPFFINFLSSSKTTITSDKLQILDEMVIEDISNIIEDDPDKTFHSLLLLYLPKLGIKHFNDCKANFRLLSNIISSNNDMNVTENTDDVINNVLDVFNDVDYDSTDCINQLLYTLEKHHSFTKRAKSTTIGQLNFTLLYIVLKKISYINDNITMNLLSSTSNITRTLMKLTTIHYIYVSSKASTKSNTFESQCINKLSMNTIHYKIPIDHLWLRLIRICIQYLVSKVKNKQMKTFIEYLSTFNPVLSFLLFHYLTYCNVDDAKVIINRLWKNCHDSFYTNENKENPSYKYKKWLKMFNLVNSNIK